MKVTNLKGLRVYLKDLHVARESGSDGRRTEDHYVGAAGTKNSSIYLPDTSDVLRSAQKGDLYKFAKAGVLSLNDATTLAAAPGPGNSITVNHKLGYPPIVTVFKKVIIPGPITTWVDAAGVVDIVHNVDFTSVVITNTVALPIDFLIRIG